MNKENFEEKKEVRVEKYQNKIVEKPYLRNQIFVKEGQAILVKNGKKYRCEKVEGFIKLSQNNYVERIRDKEIVISLLPKGKMIILCDGQWYFRGYKEENSKDFLLMLCVAGNIYNVLVFDTNDSLLPIAIIEEEEFEDGINEIVFKQFESIISRNTTGEKIVPVSEIEVKEIEHDEWE